MTVPGNFHDHRIEFHFHVLLAGLDGQPFRILGSGELFVVRLQAESVVNALEQDSSRLTVLFNQKNIFDAFFLQGRCGRKTGAPGSDNDCLIVAHINGSPVPESLIQGHRGRLRSDPCAAHGQGCRRHAAHRSRPDSGPSPDARVSLRP